MKQVLRIAIGLICLILIVDALLLVGRGIQYSLKAYHNVLTQADVAQPLLPALEAVDMFFMGIAFFIVAIGLAQLFVGDLPFVRNISFAWLRIESFGQLKMLFWDTFLVMIFVVYITHLVSDDDIGWEQLVLPIAIVLLALSSYLLKQKH
jgi:uncharacterized membrane protein YqhA